MSRYKIWDKTESILTPIGEEITAENWLNLYKWAKVPNVKAIVGGGPINGSVMMEFEATKEHYTRLGCKFTEGMTDEEVLAAIELFEDTPPEIPVSLEERAIASQEFQLMATIEDFEVPPEIVEKNYKRGLWTKKMVDKAVTKGIISEKKRNTMVAEKEGI
jgi:hypothetical protein